MCICSIESITFLDYLDVDINKSTKIISLAMVKVSML